MSALSWPFVLVNSGLERIKVTGRGKVRFEGSVPAGYAMHLMVGDNVMTWHQPTSHWRRKFYVTLTFGKPCIRYGKTAVTPHKRIWLKNWKESDGAIDPCK